MRSALVGARSTTVVFMPTFRTMASPAAASSTAGAAFTGSLSVLRLAVTCPNRAKACSDFDTAALKLPKLKVAVTKATTQAALISMELRPFRNADAVRLF